MKSLLALPVLTTVLLLVAGPAAQADVAGHRDRTGDVRTRPLGLSAPVESTAAPRMARADITRIRVDHGARQVRLTLTLRNLAKVGGETWFHATVRTDRDERQVAFRTAPGLRDGSRVLFRDGRGNPLACRGLGRSVSYSTNTATISVPRRCLANPDYVRVLATVELRENHRIYEDAAYTSGADQRLVYGPRVYR